MSIDETRRYIASRIRVAGVAKAVQDRFGEEVVDRLHGLSGGNPRRVNLLAREVARGDAGHAILMRIEPAWNDRLLEPSRSDPHAAGEI